MDTRFPSLTDAVAYLLCEGFAAHERIGERYDLTRQGTAEARKFEPRATSELAHLYPDRGGYSAAYFWLDEAGEIIASIPGKPRERGQAWKPTTAQLERAAAFRRIAIAAWAEMGLIDDRYFDRRDTCGRTECERAARDAEQAEREEAHERLDRDLGY